MISDIFEMTFENAAIGMAHVDSNGKWMRVNKQLCHFLGYSQDELLSLTFQDLTYPDDLEYDLSHVRKLYEGSIDSYSIEKRYICKDGSLTWTQLSVSAIRDEEGKVDYFISVVADINERKELNQNLEKAERLAKLGNWSLNLQSNHLHWSDEIFRIFEIDKNEFSATYEAFLNAIHPDDREMVNHAYLKSLETKEKYQIIHRLLMRDGRIKYVIEQCESVFDEHGYPSISNGTIQDITELHLIQLQLRESEQFYRTIVSAIDKAIMILENNVIIDCNLTTLLMFETTEHQLIGSNILDSNNSIECSGESFDHYLTKAYEGQTVQIQATLVLNNNIKTSKILEITLANYGSDAQKLIMLARDITQKLEDEKLFKTHTRQAQMGEMVSMIAHQWRQPLAIINAIASQLRLKEILNDNEDSDLINHLIKIEQQSLHLSQTISDYRDFFRPDKPLENILLTELIDHTLDLIDHTLKSKGVSVDIVVHCPCTVQIYRNEIIQVLISLLKNACDAFEENSILYRHIDIEINHNDLYGIIIIKDNAGGIPKDVIEKIFIPYFTTKSHSHGTGLGLYMSKMIVEEHCNGLLEISSHDQETLIVIKLPIHS